MFKFSTSLNAAFYGRLYWLAVVVAILGVGELSKGLKTGNRLKESQRLLPPVTKFRQQQLPVGHSQQNEQQRQMRADDYEKLSQEEVRSIDDASGKGDSTTRLVVPSKETNSNSQVIFVNLDRVISDIGNKNETRAVNNGRLIKQDSQIACGETNRNGVPSMNTPYVPDTIPNRIVGGNRADPGEFPYQVRLNIRSRRGSSLCGGTIIDQRHILTAAHCVTTW